MLPSVGQSCLSIGADGTVYIGAGEGLYAIGEAWVTRGLPSEIMAGEEFEVTVTFTSPADGFHAIGLTDTAPPDWIVSVDTA